MKYLIIIILLVFISCNSNKDLIGEWLSTENSFGVSAKIIFNDTVIRVNNSSFKGEYYIKHKKFHLNNGKSFLSEKHQDEIDTVYYEISNDILKTYIVRLVNDSLIKKDVNRFTKIK